MTHRAQTIIMVVSLTFIGLILCFFTLMGILYCREHPPLTDEERNDAQCRKHEVGSDRVSSEYRARVVAAARQSMDCSARDWEAGDLSRQRHDEVHTNRKDIEIPRDAGRTSTPRSRRTRTRTRAEDSPRRTVSTSREESDTPRRKERYDPRPTPPPSPRSTSPRFEVAIIDSVVCDGITVLSRSRRPSISLEINEDFIQQFIRTPTSPAPVYRTNPTSPLFMPNEYFPITQPEGLSEWITLPRQPARILPRCIDDGGEAYSRHLDSRDRDRDSEHASVTDDPL